MELGEHFLYHSHVGVTWPGACQCEARLGGENQPAMGHTYAGTQ